MQCPLPNIDRLPPELLHVQRSRQVVLADLALVQGPPVMLVLLVMSPFAGPPGRPRRPKRRRFPPPLRQTVQAHHDARPRLPGRNLMSALSAWPTLPTPRPCDDSV